jgi:hypothetical protein
MDTILRGKRIGAALKNVGCSVANVHTRPNRQVNKNKINGYGIYCSVVDPDPYVFGPPGSASHKYGTDPAPDLPSSSKNSKKNLVFYCL